MSRATGRWLVLASWLNPRAAALTPTAAATAGQRLPLFLLTPCSGVVNIVSMPASSKSSHKLGTPREAGIVWLTAELGQAAAAVRTNRGP
jgi:hypothetical protein